MAENHGYKLRIIAIICYIAAFVGVGLRFYVRKYVVGRLSIEDWLMAVGLGLYTMYISFVFVGLHYGTGQHHRDLPGQDIIMAVKYWYFCEWAYVLTTTTIKFAVGVFYLRIMIQRWQILVVKCVMAAVVIFGIAYFGCVVAQCVPAPFIWLRFAVPETYQGSCLPNVVILWGTYLHSILSASADWTLGLLPVALLWNAKMGWETKVMMCLVLGLGAIASTSTLVRLSVIHTIIDLDDFLWNTLGIAIWSTVEPGVALLAAGLATIRPLLRSLFPNLFSTPLLLEVSSTCSVPTPCFSPSPSPLPDLNQETAEAPPTLPHIQPIRSPPPIPSPISPCSPLSIPSIPLASDSFGFRAEEKGKEKGKDKDIGKGRLMGFGAGLGLGSTNGSGNRSVNGSANRSATGSANRSTRVRGSGSKSESTISRAKSWKSITSAKSEDSRGTRDGYGNITILYAEESESSKAEEVLGEKVGE